MIRLSLVTALAMIAALPACATAGGRPVLPSAPVSAFAPDAQQAMNLLNAYRSAQGQGGVTLDPTLTKVAQNLAAACSESGGCNHDTGGSLAQRLKEAGYPPSYAAENIRQNEATLDGAFAWWKASPVHNTNMLMPQAGRIGFARSPAKGKAFWILVLASAP